MKVLIVQNLIMHYRVELFNQIADFCDLTVAHSGSCIKSPIKFKEKNLKCYKIKVFNWQHGLTSLAKQFDVVILMFDIKWLSTLNFVLFKKRNFQRIYLWGIGVSSQNGLNKKNTFDFLRYWIAKKSDGVIFYSDFPKLIYEKNNIHKSKLFTSHNSIEVLYDKNEYNKKFEDFLFIGSLDSRKRINDLIDAYYLYLKESKKYNKLLIIGSGKEEENLKNQVKKLKLSNDVIFLGKIIDKKLKIRYFEKAIAVISPGQAGLSVLESMAYGVPFVTYKNAITGGEIFNIEDGKNGFKVNGKNDLVKIMINMSSNKKMLEKLSKNALNHYNKNRRIEDMVNSFRKIIINI